ncbi:MAG: hypothetical protein BWY69_00733 [Planctomycetes bacterium ADurb.Bin401]|nr:MAG: hypothetical protein BWY69_00733 [Planctomycetes bacterium ADurb.Bin401]
MLLCFAGVVPEKFHFEFSRVGVKLKFFDDIFNNSLERMQPWAGLKKFNRVLPFKNSFKSGGVGLAPEKTEPGENLSSLLNPHIINKIFPELTE